MLNFTEPALKYELLVKEKRQCVIAWGGEFLYRIVPHQSNYAATT